MWSSSVDGYRRLGAAGSVAVAAGGWAAGTLPARDPWGIWVPHGSAATVAAAVLAYAGLTLLVVAWWRYGRLIAEGARTGVRDTLVTLGWWAGPLLLAPPLYSADVYSYIAQGAMVLEGHDVYSAGPSVLDPQGIGADAAASVGGHWRDTPAPYGPVFLVLAQAVTWVTGGRIVPAVIGMRLIAVAAVVLIVWAVRHLARHGGRSEPGALWLAALNPLLLTHVVGGMHNDGLMAGLMLAGVVWAVRGRWLAGSALVGLAMMIKSPAALALLFIGVLVGRAADGPLVRRVAKGLFGPGLVAGAVAVVATVAGGTGFGWLGTQSVAGTIHTALSVTSDVGLALGELLRLLLGADPAPVKSAVQNLGLAAALALIGYLAWRAVRSRTEPVHALGLGLLALVALSPMVQPWYLLWGTVVIAATDRDGRAGRIVTVLCAALVYETQPSGHTPAYGFVLAGLAGLAGALLMRRGAAAFPPRAPVPGPRRERREPAAEGAAEPFSGPGPLSR
ncbi:polyprenol phosphomannose-dependent alpha 1,6 mannosyltransferase MptB [Streptomyces sp. SP18CS02]|uniref:polyprenol phosphomannose-dependent alpha 1,6 mannosyltransferase MptB n=1 Tax=Streptomyces sp. SP18CS02 TaxID=3002531 RepID=UPI002E76AC19|nr:polyprenol phosphomannose-dependent alpha 1,6 mannosyltransferase MptB [Streptomyces sp. SP18CS02]MEE1756271.1 polyprenol phosphomannose-dependent alpha 1,6 mannosyltransferase MptB [Streptomyces sp. SP18CS02]